MTMKLIVLTLLEIGYLLHISAEMQDIQGQKILEEEHSPRFHLDTDGTTLMEGSSPGKVLHASLLRREGLTARPHKRVKTADEEEFEEEDDFSPLEGSPAPSVDAALGGGSSSGGNGESVDQQILGETPAPTEAPDDSTDAPSTDDSPDASTADGSATGGNGASSIDDSQDASTADGDDSAANGGSSTGLLEKPASLTEKQATKVGARLKAVTWTECTNGVCSCAANRRRVVIRFRREGTSGFPAIEVSEPENWYFRPRQHGATLTYTGTPAEEFNKGFIGLAKDGAAVNLQACGGNANFSKDCLLEPVACTFQKSDGIDKNEYDAKAGEYCCSHDRKYCSYKCKEKEDFHCAPATDKNFPGGMDPTGPHVFKKCYMAQYAHGYNPEGSTDAAVPGKDVTVEQDESPDD